MSKKHIIISNPYGRLGNRLVRFANLIAYACYSGDIIINPYFKEYAHLFDYFKDQDVPYFANDEELEDKSFKKLINHNKLFLKLVNRSKFAVDILNSNLVKKISNKTHYVQLPDIADLIDSDYMKSFLNQNYDNFYLYGWLFLAPEHVKKYKKVIQKCFKPREDVCKSSEDYINKLRENSDILIAVHLRVADDFKNLVPESYLSVDFYAKILRQINEIFVNKKVTFILIPDVDIDLKPFKDINVVMSLRETMRDLHVNSFCDYTVGTSSTFSQWAAFYGDVPYLTLRKYTKYVELDDFQIHHCVFPDWFIEGAKEYVKNFGRGYEVC